MKVASSQEYDLPEFPTQSTINLSYPESPSAEVKANASQTQSERIRRLLLALQDFDSLYICPIKVLPGTIKSQVKRHPIRNYEVKDYYGRTCFYAAEITGRCISCICSNSRPFEIHMFTPDGELVLECTRSNSKTLLVCGVDCCLSGGVTTSANFMHDEHYIGCVTSSCGCNRPQYIIQNRFYDEKFHILGPKCSLWICCLLCRIKEFAIVSPDTEISVGKIIYGYDGLQEDLISNKGTVGVIFPPRITAEIKACLVTAGFMLEATYFHRRGCTFHRFLRVLSVFLMLAAVGGALYGILLFEELF